MGKKGREWGTVGIVEDSRRESGGIVGKKGRMGDSGEARERVGIVGIVGIVEDSGRESGG